MVAIPTDVFYDDVDRARTLVRWAFCKPTATFEEALRRLEALGRLT